MINYAFYSRKEEDGQEDNIVVRGVCPEPLEARPEARESLKFAKESVWGRVQSLLSKP